MPFIKQPQATKVECLPVQVGSDLVGLTSLDSMALCTTRREEGSTLAGVTCARGVSTSLVRIDWTNQERKT